MRYLLLFLFGCLLGFPTISWGQVYDFSFHHLTEEDGVPPSTNYYFFQDSRGYTWIGTDNGLLRFDGRDLVTFQHQAEVSGALPDNKITSRCFEDEQGNLWFSTHSALVVYHRKEGIFESFAAPVSSLPYELFHQEEAQRFWLRIGQKALGHLWIFDKASSAFTQSLPLTGNTCRLVSQTGDKPTHIIQTELPGKHGAYITSLESGEQRHVEFWKTIAGDIRNRPSRTKGLLMTDGNIFWTGVYDGLGKFQLSKDSTQGIIYSKSTCADTTGIEYATGILAFNDSLLLVSADVGLYFFNRKTGKLSCKFPMGESQPWHVPFNDISTIWKGHSSVYWLSSTRGELAYATVQEQRFRPLPNTEGHSVTTIETGPVGNIWFSTLEQGTHELISHKQRVEHSGFIHTGYPDRNFTLPALSTFINGPGPSWSARVGNQFLYWDEESKQFTFRLQNVFGVPNSVEDRMENHACLADGRTLINYGRKVYELRIEEGIMDTLLWRDLQALTLAPISFIGEDQRKRIYISDQTGRLVILKENADQVDVLADLPGIGSVYAIHSDTSKRITWVASSKGLGQLLPGMAFQAYNKPLHHLPQETYYNIIPDELGNLWLPSNNGLVRYYPDTFGFHRFTTADGLLSNVFSANTSLRHPETGEIWLGSKKGINVFQPKEIQLSDFQPNISFSELLINDEPFVPQGDNKGNLNEKEELVFNYAENTLSFTFTALDYRSPGANEYFYQMEGYDEERVPGGTRNFVRYANLPAGEYTFKVWATNSDKQLNPTPKTLRITIIPPFYQQTWFYLACLLLISSIIYSIFRYRLEQALQMERLRVKISSDLHDDVGGMLSGLAMQTEILELTATEEAKPKLARIAEMSRSAMARMRDTVWAIDARKDKLENLLDRMREHAEETLPPRGIEFGIQVDNLDLKQDLATDVRQNLYLIFKEAITNVAKHSTGDTVNVQLRHTAAGFEMRIHDNGKVDPKPYKPAGLGQSNLKMRAKNIGANLTVDTAEGYLVKVVRKKW